MEAINCGPEDKERVMEILENSFREEEEVSEHNISSASIGHKVVSSCKPTVVNESSMFAKLRNPVEQYLCLFKPTDGLVAKQLLQFIKVLILMLDETQMKADDILSLALPYCRGALRSKILESISEGHDIEKVHTILLNNFVPMSLREALKSELVFRPQGVNEHLNDYILQIKLYARLLKCGLKENEIVHSILVGLNERTRINTTLFAKPNTFAELEQLAIYCADVEYSNNCRRSKYSAPQRFEHSRANSGPVTCYKCGKKGHYARNCYSQTAQNTKVTGQKNVRAEGLQN